MPVVVTKTLSPDVVACISASKDVSPEASRVDMTAKAFVSLNPFDQR
jgi:hypothetical protein